MKEEPRIAVGLLDDAPSVAVQLQGQMADSTGCILPPGNYRIACHEGAVHLSGDTVRKYQALTLSPTAPQSARFRIEVTIGIDFHWQQTELHSFSGSLRVLPRSGDRLAVVNDVSLETYLASVICSEMRASSPLELIKAHSIISRSWLLAQLEAKAAPTREPLGEPTNESERISWTDRVQHVDFDVCADDHCQRYQGLERIGSAEVLRAIRDTRGQVLVSEGRVCDTRFSKCCGGITEDYRTAWDDATVPYLVPIADQPDRALPTPPLTEEGSLREFIEAPPGATYCNCADAAILERVLNDYDRKTRDFFRWEKRISAPRVGELLHEKFGLDLGRILSLEPVERGLSGRLKRLRWVGESGSVVIGKELQIRRALSATHLYSSAFVIQAEGPAARPEAFLLRGAGWGHGVGLCQIGAAVMAARGIHHREILKHYYQGVEIEMAYR